MTRLVNTVTDTALFSMAGQQLTLNWETQRNPTVFARYIGGGEGAAQKQPFLRYDDATLHPTGLEGCISGLVAPPSVAESLPNF